MKIIGLTGGIASGKSTVSQKLSELGALIIDADLIARKVVQPGEKAYNLIIKHFGSDILQADGQIDRKKLAAQVFNKQQDLKRLNEIIHPEVIEETKHMLIAARNNAVKVAVIDAPLLIEAGMTSLADEVWVVSIEADKQVQRAVQRDKVSKVDIEARIAAQMSLEEKKQFATRVIDNSGSLEATYKQVEKLFQQLNSE